MAKIHHPELEEPLSSQREPVFNAPWPAVALIATIIGGYFLQSMVAQEPLLLRWGYSPARGGHPETLITAVFLHANWAHALMNGAFALAFATPVVRFFGTGPRGALAFLLFYVSCGALGNLAFGLIHPDSPGPLIGASGAVSGLAAAAARIVAGRGEVGPLLSAPVIGMGAGWIITNLLVAILGFAPGSGGAQVAWEVHLAGFALGLVLVSPFAPVSGRTRAD